LGRTARHSDDLAMSRAPEIDVLRGVEKSLPDAAVGPATEASAYGFGGVKLGPWLVQPRHPQHGIQEVAVPQHA
jgi:hypothetical protein